MKEIIYNKLVRDKIPEIIREDDKDCEIEYLSKSEHLEFLNKKLSEELEEYLENYNIEELADLLEVIYSILDLKGISKEKIDIIRNEKNRKRGKFNKGIKLIKVINNKVKNE